MIEFNLFLYLIVLALGFGLPGALLFLGLFKKSDLNFVEKILAGFGIGIIIPAFVSWILFMCGVPFNYGIALLSVSVSYAIGLIFFIKEKAYLFSFPKDFVSEFKQNWKSYILPVLLLLVVFFSFWLRIQSYGPVFHELDPYFYLYHTYFILHEGGAPLTDDLAWYPEVFTSHRQAPLKAYLEADIYALYTGGEKMGADTDIYLNVITAGLFPPLFAALAVFFFYLFISAEYKKEFALIGASIISFVPMFFMKTLAGESEVQPYAFFGLAFFLAFYALAIKRKDLRYAVLAAIGYMATALGSSSAIILQTVLMLFIPLHALLMFFISKKKEEILFKLKSDGIVILGVFLAPLLMMFFRESVNIFSLFSGANLIILTVYLFSILLYYIKSIKIKDPEMLFYYTGGAVAIGLIIMLFTPIGASFFSIVKGSTGVAEFKVPLHRTIQEQGLAGSSFQSQIGFIGTVFQPPLYYLFYPITALVNLILSAIFWTVNALFSAGLNFTQKTDSMLHVVFFFVFLSIAHSLYEKIFLRKERLSLLYAAFIIPISMIGLLKTKYTIYMGVALGAGVGISFGELFLFLSAYLSKYKKEIFAGLVFIGILFAYFQVYGANSMTQGILSVMWQPRFQDDPLALQPKFSELCSQGVSEVCPIASDPLFYANLGTNYQYSQNLCLFSLVSDPYNPSDAEMAGVSVRCQRLAYYWVDSMEWIRTLPEDARIISWWDYGHWINYFGQHASVLRNDHASTSMIGATAYGFLHGTEEELISFMKAHDSEYALFDKELMLDTYSNFKKFGGKYGALNYLGCAHANRTSVSKSPGNSECELEHLWEEIVLTGEECTLSSLSGEKGLLAYSMKRITTPSGIQVTPVPAYCVGKAELTTGEFFAPYYLDKKYLNGDLQLNKAFMVEEYTTSQGNRVFGLFYTKEVLWLENGELKSGWEDRSTSFYDSVLYRALILQELDNFELLYTSPQGEVVIFKIK